MQNRFELAKKVADAASHLDFAKSISFMAPEDRADAERHINTLHTVAQLLAGPRNAELYSPEVKKFQVDKHYKKHIPIIRDDIELQVTQWRREGDHEAYGCITVNKYVFNLHISITPTEARQIAMALMDTADDMEASAAQFQREQAEIKVAA